MIQIWAIYYRKKELQYDEDVASVGDYSVMLRNLPAQDSRQIYNIKTTIKDFLVEKGYNVRNVNLVYDSHNYKKSFEKLREKRDELAVYLYKTNLVKEKDPNEFPEDFEAKITEMKQAIGLARKNLHSLDRLYNGQNCSEFQGIVIVSFNKESEKNDFLKIFKTCSFFRNVLNKCKSNPEKPEILTLTLNQKSYRLNVKEAPEPTDIIWKNLKYTSKERFYRR